MLLLCHISLLNKKVRILTTVTLAHVCYFRPYIFHTILFLHCLRKTITTQKLCHLTNTVALERTVLSFGGLYTKVSRL